MTKTDLEWIEFTDFSPGIFSNNNLAGGVNVTSVNPCFAQESGTWGCRALPTGGLGPLPRRKESFELTTVPDGGNGYTYTINGLGTLGFVLAGSGGGSGIDFDHRSEVHLLLSYNEPALDDTFDQQFVWLRERIYNLVPSTETIYSATAPGESGPTEYQYGYLLKTRMNPSSPLFVGEVVTVCVWTNVSRSIVVNKVFPDPDDPTITTTITLADDINTYRRAVAHQARIVLGRYEFFNRGDSTTVSTDENFVWTDTNTATLVAANATQFVPEIDQTISDMASMSANQLVCVKRIGGGYVVQGSLNDFTVVRLPNLKSPDGTATVAGTTSPLGWIYSAGDSGLYLWNGGDTSEPISPQIDGGAFTALVGDSVDRVGHVGNLERWGDFLLAPDGWCMDFNRQGWWRIEHPDQPDPLPTPPSFWSASTYQGQVISAPKTFTDGEPAFHLYEIQDLGYSYRWTSHPLWISRNHYLKCREAVVALQGTGTVTITITNEQGTQDVQTLTIDDTVIRNHRFGLNVDAENLVVQIDSEGSEDDGVYAPLVHRLFISYEPGQHIRNEPPNG